MHNEHRERSRNHHQAFIDLAKKKGQSQLKLAVDFAKTQQYLDSLVVGFCKADHLVNFMSSFESPISITTQEISDLSLNDNLLLDPRNWS